MLNKINISPNRQKLIIYVALTVVTLVAFWQVNQYGFVFDDTAYVTDNGNIQSGITLKGVCWAFSTRYVELWNPLVWLSFMLDYNLYGTNASGYHWTNVILHILSTLLLFWLFHRMTGLVWPSAFVAAFFAIHPLHVESVAWIAERKDVLSTFFWILTLCLYTYYAKQPNIRRYLVVCCCFILALMSKPMVVTLPVIMILLDYWPLRRFESHRGNIILWQLKEKSLFFILSAILIIMTLYGTDTHRVTTNPDFQQFPLSSRLANALVSCVIYLGKTFWPHSLSVLYPFPTHIVPWQTAGALLLIVVITTFVFMVRKRLPYLFVGWAWYMIAIFPVIGIIQISFSTPYAMADRYHYLPSIGIAMMVALGVPLFFHNKSTRKKILFPVAGVCLAILAILSWKQCSYWINDVALFDHALQVTKDNYVAHNNLGQALFLKGNLQEAIYHFDQAISANRNYSIAYYNRGNAYAKMGQYQRAIKDYNEAIRINPDYVDAYNNRSVAYLQLGEYQLAINDLNKAINVMPLSANSYHNRGVIYDKLWNYKQAIKDYNEAILRKPDLSDAYYNRGIIYGQHGDYMLAIDDFNKVIDLNPHDAEAYNNRGFTYVQQGRYQSAIDDYTQAIRIKPDYTEAYMNRGVAYFLMGENADGCRDAQRACTLGICRVLEFAKDHGYCR